MGAKAGEGIVAHPDVPRIAFTGSAAVGRRIQAQPAGTSVKTITLELSGTNPLIVFADADVEAAVDGALRGMNFRWQGQSCGSTSRLFVHRSLFARFITELADRMRSLELGDPLLSFGGVKNSGLGREESLEEIESYTQHKNVYIRF